MTAFGDRARRYPRNFNAGLWHAALPPVGGGQLPRQPIEFRRQRILPRRRCNSEYGLQPRQIEPRITRPPRLGGIVLTCNRNDPLDRKRHAAGLEALDDRAGKTAPARFARRRQMDETTGARAK